MANKPWYELIEEVRTEHNGIFGVQLFFGHDGNNVCRFSDYYLEKASGESGRSMQEAVERCINIWHSPASANSVVAAGENKRRDEMLKEMTKELKEAKMVFAKHTEEVAKFLNELYAIMVDPLAEGKITVSEMCTALKSAALASREFEYQHQGCKSRAVHDRAGHLLAWDPDCEECRKYPRKDQEAIDISNLRFYARMAEEFDWHTGQLDKGVVVHTLNAIAQRLAASCAAREPLATGQPAWEMMTAQIERYCGLILHDLANKGAQVEVGHVKNLAAQLCVLTSLVKHLCKNKT